MNKKKAFLILLFVILAVISNVYIIKYFELKSESRVFKLSYDLISDKVDDFQIFFSNTDEVFTEEMSHTLNYIKVYRTEKLKYIIPLNTKVIRIDFGINSRKLKVSDMKIEYNGNIKEINLSDPSFIKHLNNIRIDKEEDEKELSIYVEGEDPFAVLSAQKLDLENFSGMKAHYSFLEIIFKVLTCIAVDIIIFLFILKSGSIVSLFSDLKSNRNLIFNLAKNDFKTKFAGSYLGMIWAFVNPIITILVYWFVFEFGLRSGSPIEGVPFILWLMAGLIPWFFFSDGLNNATNCMQEYSYLVKKVVFKISILPIVKIISSLFVHLVFIGFLFIIAFCYGFYPTLETLQIFYYLFCLFFIILATSYATSAIVLFFKDLGQIINIFLQIGVWMTPIMWNYKMLPEKYQWIVKLNPMVYITEGYRDVFINKIWFWTRQGQTIYFWTVSLALFFIGTVIFKKLKPHFADVL